MVELIFVCVVFAMLISGIILAINRSYAFLSNTRVQIRATNLTREWMEMMFNIRDTNRRKYSGEKEKYRLYIGSWSETQLANFFQPWIYTIKEWRNGNWDRFVYAESLNVGNVEQFYDLEWFFTWNETQREQAKVVFTWNYRYWSWSADNGDEVTWELSDLLWDWVEFYRIVRVYGIYKKNVDSIDSPANNQDSTPKEMRFCVKTFYKLGAWTHSLELCSMMTNFME